MRLLINEKPWEKEMNSESNQLSKFEKAEEYVNHTTEILLAMKNSTGQTTCSLPGKKKKEWIRKEKEKYRIPQQI